MRFTHRRAFQRRLQALAAGAVANAPSATVLVILLDGRPEDVIDFQRTVPGAEIVASSVTFGAAGSDTSIRAIAVKVRPPPSGPVESRSAPPDPIAITVLPDSRIWASNSSGSFTSPSSSTVSPRTSYVVRTLSSTR